MELPSERYGAGRAAAKVKKPASNRLVDFNSILMGVNLLVAALLVYGFSLLGDDNPYVDAETIILALLLCLQTLIALVVERKRRDPFVIVLAYIMIFYFSLRIFTLVLYPYSDVFPRFPYEVADSNYAMIFILLANTCLYLGLYAVKTNIGPIAFGRWGATTPVRVLFLLLVVSLFAYTKTTYWTAESVPQVFLFLEAFIYPGTVFLMAYAYCLAFGKSLGRPFTLLIIAALVVEMTLHSLAGSRGAIIDAMERLMIVLLALGGSIRLAKRYVIWGMALMPVVGALMVGVFFVSTYVRGPGIKNPLDLTKATDLAGEALSRLPTAKVEDAVLSPVFARAGFFDFSAEIIAHRDRYSGIISLPTYFKSIVDNVLSPGFDLFDQPKISNTLVFAYGSRGAPSKELIAGEYQSDQLGLYGELYGLFGYASLPLFLALAFALKRMYVRLKAADPFALTMKKALLLLVFDWIINSYGLDWILLNSLLFVVSVWMYLFFFRTRLHEESLVRG